MIKLHPQLEKDCIPLGDFTLCSLLLINDANYPWFILLPNRENVIELHHLTISDQQQFLAESMHFSHCLEAVFQPDKLNIAALGNIVPQLHIHHIARLQTDACWPSPVWGRIAATPYTPEKVDTIKSRLDLWFEKNQAQSFKWAEALK